MLTRFSVSTVIVLAAAVWATSLWLFAIEISWAYAKPFSITLFVVTALLTIFDRFIWRWPIVCWFHTRPDISGHWSVTLNSTYIDPKTNEASKTIIGEAVVKQTFSTLSIRMKTDSMDSHLIAERIIRHGDGACEIIGVFQSDPHIELRGTQSEIHYGAFRYSVDGNPPAKMKGHYWTDRTTKGSIQLLKKK